MTNRISCAVLATSLIAACSPPADTNVDDATSVPDANTIARTSIIIDTHIDVPYRLDKSPADISKTTKGGDFDYPRSVSGGLNAPYMSIYTPAELEEIGRAHV